MTGRTARILYGLALFTLPGVGIGVLRLSTGRDWGWGLQPAWLFLALAMVVSAVRGLGRGRFGREVAGLVTGRVPRWWILGVGGVVVALGLSAAGLKMAPSGIPGSEIWARYGKQVIQLGIMSAFTAWAAVWTRGEERWRWTIGLVLAGALGQAAYGLLQAVAYRAPFALFEWLEYVATSNPSILAGSRDLYLDGVMHAVPRLRGTVCEPLYLGNYLLLALPLAVVAPWPARRRRALFTVLLVLLASTWSRGAWLAGAGALVVVLLLGRIGPAGAERSFGMRRDVLKPMVLLAGVVFLVVGAAAILGWQGWRLPFERLAQTFNREDWSNLTRLYSMQAGWRAFLLNPLFGVGWGQFGFHFPLLVDPLGLQSQFSWPVANNFPLKILCETGLVGGGVFLALLGRVGVGVMAALRRTTDRESRHRLLALTGGFLAVWIQLLTFSQYNLPHIWVALGLLLAALAEAEAAGAEANR